MRTITAGMAAMAAMAGVLEACTASSTVDHARQARDTDQYTAARDVAEEFVDAERWVEDEYTIESGTGCLLLERTWYANIPNDGASPDDWRSILGNTTGAGHGITATGREVGTLTVKDHMRLHVMEWSKMATRPPSSSLPPALPPTATPATVPATAPSTPIDHAG